MTYPILVTVPFGDAAEEPAEEKSDERKEFEDRLIDAMLKDEVMAELAFYGSWYFYPYRNPNPRGQPLTPKQLYDVLHEELDLFLPPMDTVEAVKGEFMGRKGMRKQRYRHPFVPAHVDKRTDEEQIGHDEQQEWTRGAFVIVADDVACRWARLIHVSDGMSHIRLLRHFRRQGHSVEGAIEHEFIDTVESDRNASDTDDERDPPKETFFKRENKVASDWLGLASPRTSYLYGIQAGYMPLDFIQAAAANLEQGNQDFGELMEQIEEQVDEKAIFERAEDLGRGRSA